MSLATALRNDDGTITVPAHELGAALLLRADGSITKQQAIEGARIPDHAEADLDALAAVYTGKTSAVAKLAYVLKVEKVAMLYQDGTLTTQQAATLLELG